jgi:gluconokinase
VRTRCLVVAGVSGTGKPTIGSALARELGWAYGDTFHPADIAKVSAGNTLDDEDRVRGCS